MPFVIDPWIDLRNKPEPRNSGSSRKYDPLQETQLLAGEKVNILEDKGDWLFIEALDQPVYNQEHVLRPYTGWILNKGLGQEPPRFAQKPILPIEHFIDLGLTFLNVPYLWGGLTYCLQEDENVSEGSFKGIDCSGLVHYLYRRCGYQVPRNAADQYLFASPIALEELEPRDLLFLSHNKIYHVMIYLGGEEWLEATSDSMNVRKVLTTNKLGVTLTQMKEGRHPKDSIQAFAAKIHLEEA